MNSLLRAFILLLLLAPLTAFADELYDYESVRCIPDLGFFEYSRIPIYNIEAHVVRADIRPANTFVFQCQLSDDISISVEPDRITIQEGPTVVYRGRKILDLIRVSAEGTVELCSLPSEIYGNVSSMRAGCIWRGFLALKADGPRNPVDVLRIIRRE